MNLVSQFRLFNDKVTVKIMHGQLERAGDEATIAIIMGISIHLEGLRNPPHLHAHTNRLGRMAP
jgi:hypothetical protein